MIGYKSQTTSPKAGHNCSKQHEHQSKCKLRCDQKHSTNQNGVIFDSKYKHYKLKTSIAKPLPRYRLKILSPYNMHKDDLAGEFLIHDYYVSNAKLSAEWTLAGVTPLHITHKIRV